ncbi:Signal transduction histidine kinase [Frankineae bacterium MT45]|nr:Signal transduction histidine kinase [Frankineae bacterium MT45]
MTIWQPVEDPRTRSVRAWVQDVAVTLLVAALSVPNLLQHPNDHEHHPLVGVIGTVLLIVPLLVRRVWPIPTFGAILLVGIGFAASDVWFVGSLAFPVALYSVVSLCTRRQGYTAAVLLEVFAAVIAVTRNESNGLLLYFILLSGMVAAALGLGLYTSTRRAYIRELVDRADRLEREQAQAAELAVATERARIAREMHDILAHHLTVMVSLSDAATRLVRADPDRAIDTIATIATTGRAALGDTRSLLGLLSEYGSSDDDGHEPRQPIPDLAALESLVDQVRDTGLAVTLRMQGNPTAIAADAQLAAYRVVQESLTNTMKHAHAGSSATVTLKYGPAGLEVTAEDDGAGHPVLTTTHAGRGSSGMRARIEALGGHVESGPRPGSGWRVSATIPIEAHPDSDRPSARSDEAIAT